MYSDDELEIYNSWNINVYLFLICLVDKARPELEQVPKVRMEHESL